MKVVRLSSRAIIPTQKNVFSAGFDLYSAYDYIIPAKCKNLIKTDLQIQVPWGTYGRIASTSTLAWNKSIVVEASTIDYDFKGNVIVLMFNHSNYDFYIRTGDCIAQLICEKISIPVIKAMQNYNTINMEDDPRNPRNFQSGGTDAVG